MSAPVPLVLREVRTGHFTIVGECYLYGSDRLEGCFAMSQEMQKKRHFHALDFHV